LNKPVRMQISRRIINNRHVLTAAFVEFVIAMTYMNTLIGIHTHLFNVISNGSSYHNFYTTFLILFFASSIIGGLANRFYHHHTLITTGLFLFGIGLIAALSSVWFVTAMALLTLGAGLLHPNIITYVSQQFDRDDRRRTLAITLLYIGANTGVLVSVMLKTWSANVDWQSLIVTNAGLCIFAASLFLMVCTNTSITDKRQYAKSIYLIIGLTISAWLISFMLAIPAYTYIFLIIVTLGSFCYIVILAARSNPEHRIGYATLLVLLFLNIAFWTNRNIMGQLFDTFFPHIIDSSNWQGITGNFISFNFIESGLVIITSITLFFLLALKYRRITANTLLWFIGLSTITGAIVAFLYVLTIHYSDQHHTTIRNLLILSGFIISIIGEISIGPASLSLIGQLIPRHNECLVIGILECAVGLSQLNANTLLGTIDWQSNLAINATDARYTTMGIIVAIIAFAALVLYFGILRPIWHTLAGLTTEQDTL